MSERITSVVKDGSEITEYVLSNGQKVTKAQGVEMAQKGEIEGVTIAHSKKGESYLRSKLDGSESNNLSSMASEE